MNLRRSRVVPSAALAVTALLALASPTGAAEASPSAYVAKVTQEVSPAPASTVGPLAYADKGKPEASVPKVSVANIVTAGAGSSKVAVDGTGAQTVTSTLADLRAGVARPAAAGLNASTITVTCTASEGGQPSGKVEILDAQLAGVKLPSAPAPNTPFDIPGPVPDGAPLGKLVLNEQVANADGTLTVYGAHLSVDRGPLGTVDVVLGAATCGNATPPATKA
jgi:hypothetical protein